MTATFSEHDMLAVNTIRTLSIDGVQAANSGHPGLPMGAAPMAYVLWSRFLKMNPTDPAWPDRDRFILSAGHGSMLLYSLLHLAGYDLALDDLKRFRQWGSKTPGHPEVGMTPGVEVTTGPLGQGFGNGVGVAMAEAFLAARYNRPDYQLFNHYTYALVSDGDLMEGVAAEAASLAGHLKLGKLIYLYDDNLISLDGPTNLAFTEDVLTRFAGYGWHTQRVADGNDLAAIAAAISAAQAETERPSLIAMRTIIGYGSSRAGTSKVHGSPLGPDDVRHAKQQYGFDPDQSFVVDPVVRELFQASANRGQAAHQAWQALFHAYGEAYPSEAAELATALAGQLPTGWDHDLPLYTPAQGEVATRDASGAVLKLLHQRIPWLVGGSADLSESTKTPYLASGSFQPGSYQSPIVWFGVREHGMGAALNGMAAHGGIRPYGGTFFTFADYMRGSIRLSALSHHPVIYVFTHDSIGLGEDGPTHQPVEHLASLRAMPNLVVIRPADANETVVAWQVALERSHGPTALVFSRQKLPVLDQSHVGSAAGVRQGAYIVSDSASTPEVILLATGSELSLAQQAWQQLSAEGIQVRLVSFPSWELFAQQPQSYRDHVLPPSVRRRVAIEAGVSQGWHQWVTDGGTIISVDRFGASAPYQTIYREYGLTTEHVVAAAKNLLS